MVKIEIETTWCDVRAVDVLAGFKNDIFVKSFSSQAEADDWKAKMEEHYNQKDDVR